MPTRARRQTRAPVPPRMLSPHSPFSHRVDLYVLTIRRHSGSQTACIQRDPGGHRISIDFVLFLETFVQFDTNMHRGRAPVVAQPFSLRILATARDCLMQASCLVKRPALLGCTQFSDNTTNSLLNSLFSPTCLVMVHTQEFYRLWALPMGGSCSNNLVLVKINNGSPPRSHVHRSTRRYKQEGLLSRGAGRRGAPERNSQQHPTCLGIREVVGSQFAKINIQAAFQGAKFSAVLFPS